MYDKILPIRFDTKPENKVLKKTPTENLIRAQLLMRAYIVQIFIMFKIKTITSSRIGTGTSMIKDKAQPKVI